MAEVAGSIIGIVAFGLQLATTLNTYVELTSEAEDTLREIAFEVNATASTLQQLQDIIDEDKAIADEQATPPVFKEAGLREINTLAGKCEKVYSAIITLVEKASNLDVKASKGSSAQKTPPMNAASLKQLSVFRRLRWPWLAPRINRAQEQLRWLKMSLLLNLQIAQLARSQIGPATDRPVDASEREQVLRNAADRLRERRLKLTRRIARDQRVPRRRRSRRRVRTNSISSGGTVYSIRSDKTGSSNPGSLRLRVSQTAGGSGPSPVARRETIDRSSPAGPGQRPRDVANSAVYVPSFPASRHPPASSVDIPDGLWSPASRQPPEGSLDVPEQPPTARQPPAGSLDVPKLPRLDPSLKADPEPPPLLPNPPQLLEPDIAPHPGPVNVSEFTVLQKSPETKPRDWPPSSRVADPTGTKLSSDPGDWTGNGVAVGNSGTRPPSPSKLSFVTRREWVQRLFSGSDDFLDDQESDSLEAFVIDNADPDNITRVPFGHRRLEYGLRKILKEKNGRPWSRYTRMPGGQRFIVVSVTDATAHFRHRQRAYLASKEYRNDDGKLSTILFYSLMGTVEPIHFTDAVGRRFDLPFESCRRWATTKTVIYDATKHLSGMNAYVEKGYYDLRDDESGNTILPKLWESAVKPGSRITMSMWPKGTGTKPPLAEQMSDRDFDKATEFLRRLQEESPARRTRGAATDLTEPAPKPYLRSADAPTSMRNRPPPLSNHPGLDRAPVEYPYRQSAEEPEAPETTRLSDLELCMESPNPYPILTSSAHRRARRASHTSVLPSYGLHGSSSSGSHGLPDPRRGASAADATGPRTRDLEEGESDEDEVESGDEDVLDLLDLDKEAQKDADLEIGDLLSKWTNATGDVVGGTAGDKFASSASDSSGSEDI